MSSRNKYSTPEKSVWLRRPEWPLDAQPAVFIANAATAVRHAFFPEEANDEASAIYLAIREKAEAGELSIVALMADGEFAPLRSALWRLPESTEWLRTGQVPTRRIWHVHPLAGQSKRWLFVTRISLERVCGLGSAHEPELEARSDISEPVAHEGPQPPDKAEIRSRSKPRLEAARRCLEAAFPEGMPAPKSMKPGHLRYLALKHHHPETDGPVPDMRTFKRAAGWE